MSPTPLLSVERLGRKLDRRWLWRGLSFELFPQTRMGLIGPSGSGKTLLLRALVALDLREEGEIFFTGRALERWHLPQYRQRVLYLPQRPAFLEGTVEQNLQTVFRFAVQHGRTYDRARILTALATLGRGADFLKRSTQQLSGGEGQIASLLRGLQLEPQILLLDEPTASLDPDSTQAAEILLDRWLEAAPNRACIWTSHDSAQIDRVTNARLQLQDFIPSTSCNRNT